MILRAANLSALEWLEHGFGTRLSVDWPPEPYANLRQVHSDIVVSAGAEACGILGDGDGLVTATPGLWIGVRTADCAPVILADPVRRAVAVIHAGWRGTVGMIVARAVARMGAEFGRARRIWLGRSGRRLGRAAMRWVRRWRGNLRLGGPTLGDHVDMGGTYGCN